MTTVAELLDGHVTVEVECADRLYLNGYVPTLATGAGMTGFLREHLGKPIPSPAVLGQITTRFREASQTAQPCCRGRHPGDLSTVLASGVDHLWLRSEQPGGAAELIVR